MNALSSAQSDNGDVKTSNKIDVPANLSSIESQNGVSSDYIPADVEVKKVVRWYVLRSVYNRSNRVVTELSNAGFDFYYPKRNVIKRIGTRKVALQEPYIPNLIFVNSSREAIDHFLHLRTSDERYIKYLLDKTKAKEWNDKNPPLIIDDASMANFKKICDTGNENIRIISPENYKMKPGDTVLVTDGIFKGVEGKYIHTLGQWRVVIQLSSIGLISTAYVPKAFVKVIK